MEKITEQGTSTVVSISRCVHQGGYNDLVMNSDRGEKKYAHEFGRETNWRM
jgi:hypothetical protein